MDINIEITEEEKVLVLEAISVLNKIQHVKYMSQAMIATEAGIKATKVRHVLTALIAEGRIIQYAATENKKLQRFYYVICDTPVLEEVMDEQDEQDLPGDEAVADTKD